jgi:molybdate transport system substrate-binding protein
MNGRAGGSVVLAMLLVACQPSPSPSVQAVELTVFAAASLQDTLDAVTTVYTDAVPGTTLVIATDSSAALRTQIQEGAPADVFLSADTANPDALVDRGLVTGDTVAYAGNSLALVVPTENPAGIRSPADLGNEGVQVIAAGPEVPITTYAEQVLTSLSKMPGYPAGYIESYAANVVSEEENVRSVLTKLELGEGDAGFVYQTDAQSSLRVTAIPIPEAANVSATYVGCVIATSDHAEEATAFLEWLAGPVGQAVLGEFGFVAP